MGKGFIISAAEGRFSEKAVQLSESLRGDGLDAVMAGSGGDPAVQAQTEDRLILRVEEKGLTLTDGRTEIRGDFSSMRPRLQHHNLTHELLVKAARLKDRDGVPTVIDATAGLGQDALLLAAAGFRVELYEQDPVIAALLSDALERASSDPDLTETVGRMQLRKADSIRALREREEAPDVIYLDPMFPERQKSALVKKKFQLLHQLESPCRNEEELFQAAVDAHPFKIVVKRPLKGPNLAGRKPGYSLAGKAVRYDCFVFPEYRKRQG